MELWENEFAKELKSRDNPKPIGACIGKVISTSPFKVSIQNGRYFLDASNTYICNQILERETTFNNYSASGSISTACPISSHSGAGYSESGASGSVHLNEVWHAGDYVMVVPDASQQHFFIVDILKGVS